jgi:dihydrofolate reductase
MYTFPGSKPLKNRRNMILSRNPDFKVEGGEVYPDLDSLMAQVTDPDNTYVVGGAMVYNTMIGQCDKAYVTKIDAEYPADCWFPNLDEDPDWEITADSDELTYFDLSYRFVKYERKHVEGI